MVGRIKPSILIKKNYKQNFTEMSLGLFLDARKAYLACITKEHLSALKYVLYLFRTLNALTLV